jgi:uncharacterized protein YcfJ
MDWTTVSGAVVLTDAITAAGAVGVGFIGFYIVRKFVMSLVAMFTN